MVELMKLAVNVHKSCDPFLKKIALDGRFASDHHDVYGWILLLGKRLCAHPHAFMSVSLSKSFRLYYPMSVGYKL